MQLYHLSIIWYNYCNGGVIVQLFGYPYVRLAMLHKYIEGYYIERHMYDHEIIIIDKGSMKITIEGESYIVKEDDCILLRPNIHHKIEWNGEDCLQPHVHFDFSYTSQSKITPVSMITKDRMNEKELSLIQKDWFKENSIAIPIIIHLKEPHIAKGILFEIIKEFDNQSAYKELLLSDLLLKLVHRILIDYSLESVKLSRPYQSDIEKLITHMHDNIENDLSLDDMAKYINLSKWNLIHYFNAYFNQSPVKYQNSVKYHKVKFLLQYSAMNVKEIAYKFNFDTPQTFTRWFKKLDNHPPLFYIEKRIKS